MSNQTVSSKFVLDISDIKTALNQAANKFKQFSDNAGKGVDDLNKKLGGTQGGFAKIGLAIQGIREVAGVFNTLASGAVQYDSKMREVKSLTQLSREEFQAMRDEVRGMSLEIPKASGDLAGGLYQVVSAGIEAGDSVEFLEVSARAAVAGLTETSVSVDAITSVINAYTMDASEAENVSDQFFKTIKLGKTTFAELAPTLGQVIPIASTYRVEFDQIGAAYATLTKNGVPTARAATSIGRAISEMVIPGSKAEKAILKLRDANGELIYKSGEAALKQDDLITVIDKLNKSGVNLASIFGEEAARAVLVLSKNIDMAKNDLKEMNNAAGATNEAFDEIKQSFSAAAQALANEFNSKLIELGEVIFPIITSGFKILTAAIRNAWKILLSLTAAVGYYNIAMGKANAVTKIAIALQKTYRIALAMSRRGVMSVIRSLKTLRVALVSTGIGAAILALGFAFEFLFNRTKDATIQTESLTEAEKNLADAIDRIGKTTDIDSLSSQYKTLEKAIGATSKEYKQYAKEAREEGDAEKQRLALLALQRKNDLIAERNAVAQRIATLNKAGVVSEKATEAEYKLLEIAARRTKTYDDDINILEKRKAALLEEAGSVENLTTAERIRYEKLIDAIDKLNKKKDEEKTKTADFIHSVSYLMNIEGSALDAAMDKRKKWLDNEIAVLTTKAALDKADQKRLIALKDERNKITESELEFKKSIADREFEIELRKRKLAGETEAELLQVRIDRMKEELNSEQLTEQQRADLKLSIEEAKMSRQEALGEKNVSFREQIANKVLGIEKKTAAMREGISLQDRVNTAKDTLMGGINAAVSGVKSAAKVPFPGNLIAVPAVLMVIFAALKKAKDMGGSILKMGEGGLVDKPQLALIGEAVHKSGTELVTPTKTFTKYMDEKVLPNIMAKITGGSNNEGVEKRLDQLINRPQITEKGLANAVSRNIRGQL